MVIFLMRKFHGVVELRGTLGAQMKYSIIGFVLFVLSSVSHSAVIGVYNESGLLTGINGVQVDNIVYNIQFNAGPCTNIALFDGCDEPTDFQFENEVDTLNVATQILAIPEVVDIIKSTFDDMFGIGIEGCTNNTFGSCLLLFATLSDEGGITGTALHAINRKFTALDKVNLFSLTADLSRNDTSGVATFVTGTPVPVPAAVWLFVTGIAGFVGFSRVS